MYIQRRWWSTNRFARALGVPNRTLHAIMCGSRTPFRKQARAVRREQLKCLPKQPTYWHPGDALAFVELTRAEQPGRAP